MTFVNNERLGIGDCPRSLVLFIGDLGLSGSVIRKSRFIFTKQRRTIRQKSGCLNHLNERIFQANIQMQGGSIIPGMEVNKNKGVGVGFADFISFILNIP